MRACPYWNTSSDEIIPTMAPMLTHWRTPLYPRRFRASATGASPVSVLQGAMPVSTSATEI